MVPRLCDRHAAARLTRRHLKVLLVDLGYAVNPFIVLQVLVARGLGDIGAVLAKYHHLLREQSEDMQAIGRLQDKIEANDGWSIDSKVSAVLSRLQLCGTLRELSGARLPTS